MIRDEKLNWTKESVAVCNTLSKELIKGVKQLRIKGFSYEDIMCLYFTSIDETILRCIREEKSNMK